VTGTDILVLNLGADRQFKHALDHVTGLVQTIAETTRSADVFVATSRSPSRIAHLLDDRIGLLHVMGHGTSNGELSAGHRSMRMAKAYSVDGLQDWVRAHGRPLRVDGLLLDACNTYSDRWLAGIEGVLAPRRPAVLIGTTRTVGWDETATYTGAFYASLLRHRLPSHTTRRLAAFLDAHQRAVSAYRTLLDKPTPFKAIKISR
jgi:hypothetical protein